MSQEYHIPCEAGSLGDMLAATAVFKNGRTGSVEITDEPRLRNFASIFDDLCEVRFVPSVKLPMPVAGTGPAAKRVLNALGIDDYGTPYVKPKNTDINWAIDWIFQKGIKHPFVVNTNVGGSPKEHYRKIPHDSIQYVIDKLVDYGATPILFGVSENREKFNNVIDFPDLPISKLSAMYKTIGNYVGCDTGDYHLMVAVGGYCWTFVPDNCWHYNYDIHHYTPDCFPPNNTAPRHRSRVQYINFKDYKQFLEKRK